MEKVLARKNSLTIEKFPDCGKFTLLTAEIIIGLTILKTNTSAETIETYFLSLEWKLSLHDLFVVNKINIIFS